MLVIRPETSADVPGIGAVCERAFGRPDEAVLVERLRRACDRLLSLVAERDGQVVGHILFSPAVIQRGPEVIPGMGLGPLAVLPDCQRQGIGSELVNHGLDILRQRSCRFVVVLGHPRYYARFGFQPARRYNVRAQWDGIPDDVFMILAMGESVAGETPGTARYRDKFNEAV